MAIFDIKLSLMNIQKGFLLLFFPVITLTK